MKAAIIGAGQVSGEHAKAYLALGVKVVAICSRTKQASQQKITELGISAKAYNNLDTMLDHEEIDVISICSPPELHVEHAIKAANRGIHLAIEKPVALNQIALHSLHFAIAQSGVKNIVSFVLRWNDLMLNIKRNYLSRIGKIFYIEIDYWHGSSHEKEHKPNEYGTRAQPISAFIGGGCHAVDMARFLVSSQAAEVVALSPFSQSKGLQRTTAALLKFHNGALAKVSATDEVFMPYMFNVIIFGTEGSILLNQFYSRASQVKSYERIKGTTPDSGAVWHHPFRAMIQELIDCIKNNRETSCGIKDVINTHRVCFAAEESAMLGGKKIYV